jgi:acetyl esterase/lipase
MKRVKYKTIPRYYTQISPQWCEWVDTLPPKRMCYGPGRTQVPTTPCKLEMRVYKKDLAAGNLRAAIAVHGGSWQHRGGAFLGLESQISHLTQRGFVVFAPFYRLVGSSDGNLECNDASGADVVQDMNDAFAWVQANKASFGAAANNDVYVMGQSAGAHLAGLLAVEHPAEVKRALMLYSPTDARDLITRYQQVPPVIDSPDALSILEDYLGLSLKTVNPNDTFVMRNTLPIRIADSATRSHYFLIHGRADPLVPSRQSVRLCNALSKSSSAGADFDSGPAANDGGSSGAGVYRKKYACEGAGVNGSKLHLLAEAEHMLDFCIPQVSCPAGSSQSVGAARSSLGEGYNWLAGRPSIESLVPIINSILGQ